MRAKSLIFFVTVLLISQSSFPQNISVSRYTIFNLKKTISIRAIDVMNDSTVWFAASAGAYGCTHNGGRYWYIDSMKIDTFIPDFRSLAAINDSIVMLMNAGSPAFIMKSTNHGKTWRIVYENHSKEIFLDAMKFTDSKNGFALGDPIDGQFQIIETNDGGDHWEMKKNLPAAFMGEACFASSNSSFDIEKNVLWIGTGGSYNRVLSLYDDSKNWSSSTALVQCCGSLKGIFSLDFYDDQSGIVVGGDYAHKTKTDSTAAITHDGGKSWKIISSGILPMGSCVQFRPGSNGKEIFVACLPGIYFSNDAGENWEKLEDENGKEINDSYYVLDFSPSGKTLWLAGANGKIARLDLK